MNYKLIKVFGIARSGNHPIINWIMGHTENKGFFCNNRKVSRDIREKPSPCSMSQNFKMQARRHNDNIILYDLDNIIKDHFDTVVIGYENFNLKWHNKVVKDLINRKIYEIFGKTDNEISVIIIRNPLNVLSSILSMNFFKIYNRQVSSYEFFLKSLKHLCYRYLKYILSWKEWFYVRKNILFKSSQSTLHATSTVENMISGWSYYASVFLKEQSLLSKKVVCINFDKFIISKDYRQKIAKDLGFEYNDQNFNFISDAGSNNKIINQKFPDEQMIYDLLFKWKKILKKNEIDNLILKNRVALSKFKIIYPNEYRDFMNFIKETN